MKGPVDMSRPRGIPSEGHMHRVLVVTYDFPPSMAMGAQACAQIAQCALDARDLRTQTIMCALHMQRHVEWPILSDLKLQRPQVAPLDLQQRLMVADLFDQLFFIHRFYHLLSVRKASGACLCAQT